MKILKHTKDELEIELCLTNVKQLHDQLVNHPDSPCWICTTINGVQLKIVGTFNTGIE
jgi:hypothetical protein